MKKALLVCITLVIIAVCVYAQSVIGARVTHVEEMSSGWTYIHYEMVNSSNKSGWYDFVLRYTDTSGGRKEYNSYRSSMGAGWIGAYGRKNEKYGVKDYGGNASVQVFFRE